MITTKTFTIDASLNPDRSRTMSEIREDFPQLPARPAAPHPLLYRNETAVIVDRHRDHRDAICDWDCHARSGFRLPNGSRACATNA